MIIEGLFIGNNAAMENATRLKMLVSFQSFLLNPFLLQNISHVLVLSQSAPTVFDQDIKYMCVELHDDYKSNIFYHLV